jgi:hypothetical protein
MHQKDQKAANKKLQVRARRASLLKLLTRGASYREAREQLKAEGHQSVALGTLVRDVREISKAMPSTEEQRFEVEQELRSIREFIVSQATLSDREVIDSLLAVHDRLAKLLGLNLERNQVNVLNVDGNDSETLQGYARFKAATKFIHSEEKWQRIWDFVAELGPDPINLTMPPSPEPKQLSESGAIEAPDEHKQGGNDPCDS